MADAKDAAWEQHIERQVTANPFTWWRWPAIRALFRRTPRIRTAPEEQPYVTLATPPLAAPKPTPCPVMPPISYNFWQRKSATWLVNVASNVARDAWRQSQTVPPCPVDLRSLSDEVAWLNFEGVVLKSGPMPFPSNPTRPTGDWFTRATRAIQREVDVMPIARYRQLEDVAQRPDDVTLSLTIAYPAHWITEYASEPRKSIYLNTLIPHLAGLVGDVLHLPETCVKECIADEFMELLPVAGDPWWGFTVSDMRQPREMRAA